MTTITGVPSPRAGADPRLLFDRAVALGGSVVAQVREDQLHLPTPFGEYDVRQLVAHLVEVLHRVAAVGRGRPGVPSLRSAGLDGQQGWPAAWALAANEALAAWADPDVLSRRLRMSGGDLSGALAMGAYTADVTVHTWDLATATGQRPAWDDEVVAASLRATNQVAREELRVQDRSQPCVAVHPSSPLIEQLVAWNGRICDSRGGPGPTAQGDGTPTH